MKTSRFLLAACVSLALAFTFSCSSDDGGGGGGNTGGGGSCSIDGYRTVEIGDQTWMAENLNCNVSGSVCYDNDPANCTKYGRLYDWTTAKTVCPSGWHLPSDADWGELMSTVGGWSNAGTKLKATSGWNNTGNSTGNGTDDFGFSALPGGYSNSYGGFGSVGFTGYWWSSTESVNQRTMHNDNGYVSTSGVGGVSQYSVRCLRN